MKPSKNNGTHWITLCDERIGLHPSGAVWWPEEHTIFIADVHLGKSAAFRSAGLPVPDACKEDLDRLTSLVEECSATRLIVLGDFFHARAGRTGHLLRNIDTWRKKHAQLHMTLIRGNHDRSSGDPPSDWNIQVEDNDFKDGPFLLRHEPPEPTRAKNTHSDSADTFILCGHVHPAVRVGSVSRFRGETGARFRAFVLSLSHMILPAFGTFTGSKRVDKRAQEQVFVIADNEVLQIQ